MTHYRGATMAMALLLVAGVTMGQMMRDVEFGTVTCRNLTLINPHGVTVLEARPTTIGYGSLVIYGNEGNPSLVLGALDSGGSLVVYDPQGRQMMICAVTDDGRSILGLMNKTGEEIVTLKADEYGNGVVGAWNRKGKGRTLIPS